MAIRINPVPALAALAIVTTAGAAAAQVPASLLGTWKRPNGDIARVYDCGGKLCGKVVKGEREGLEMFNAMTPTGANRWQGGHMKHPGMPSFFTFNGTVTLEGAELKVKGCAIGQAMCDSEVWTKVK